MERLKGNVIKRGCNAGLVNLPYILRVQPRPPKKKKCQKEIKKSNNNYNRHTEKKCFIVSEY